MKQSKNANPSFFLFTGIAMILLGLGAFAQILNSTSMFTIFFALMGGPIGLVAGIISLNQYVKTR